MSTLMGFAPSRVRNHELSGARNKALAGVRNHEKLMSLLNHRCILSDQPKEELLSPKIPSDELSNNNDFCSPSDENLRSMLACKKLHLVLDLDHTLVDTVRIEDLMHAPGREQEYLNQLWAHKKVFQDQGLVTKLRPYAKTFIEKASTMFELSVYTMKSRDYAECVLNFLDPERKYVSRSNVFAADQDGVNPKKGLHVIHVVPLDERFVLVVDDLKVVWEKHPDNLIEIGPYEYFATSKLPWSKKKNCSLSEFRADESENYGELVRVLKELKKIHIEFFKENEGSTGEPNYASRDVREVAAKAGKEYKRIEL